MASETRAASSWSSVARTGDNGFTWGGIGSALSAIDSNYAINDSWEPVPTPPAPTTSLVAKLSPILRVGFSAFSLPANDIVVSAILSVRHRQNSSLPLYAGTSVEFTNVATTLGNSFTTTTVSISGLTVASLNAGTTLIDLLYRAVGGPVPAPLFDEFIPTVAVDYVTLAIETIAPRPMGSYNRIPNFGIN